MADESSSALGVPTSVWIFLAVGVAGVLAVSHRPFQDFRPPGGAAAVYSHTPSELQDVEARQWEDPLAAAANARDREEKKAPTAMEQAVIGYVSKTPQQRPPPDGTLSRAPVPRHSLEALEDEIDQDLSKGPLMIVGALVPGSPYADDMENRRRIRYSVLAGLFGAQFVPDNNEHIGYVTLSELYDKAPYKDGPHAEDLAAYEWFHREVDSVDKPRILLLWLDQDGFRATPLSRLSSLFDKLLTQASQRTSGVAQPVTKVILGPADSDGLREMSDEIRNGEEENCDGVKHPENALWVYSARATASDRWILGDRPHDPAHGTLSGALRAKCGNIHLMRTVSTDDRVVQAVFDELHYRGVLDPSEIALVAERDTLYARLMTQYFNGCEGTPRQQFGKHPLLGDDPNKQPLCFTYLRGMDGLAPTPTGDSAATGKESDVNEPTSNAPSSKADETVEASIGQSQFDYLRRLAASLASRVDPRDCGNRTTDTADGAAPESAIACHHIKAIGILGSDFYDKMLVLQALRNAFPRYLFFTTDLDARLTDEQNLAWTRELIVGSSLGLALRPELQHSVPPFRDSYQSATYYSMLLAAKRFATPTRRTSAEGVEPAGMAWTAHPHVYEIGRTEAFDLTGTAKTEPYTADTVCHIDGYCPVVGTLRPPPLWSRRSPLTVVAAWAASIVTPLVIMVIAMGSAWHTTLLRARVSTVHPQPRRRLAVYAVGLLSFSLLTMWGWHWLIDHVTNGGPRIPTPIFGGAGRWAGMVVEMISILAIITLIIRGQRKLFDNAETIRKEFKFPIDNRRLIAWHAEQLRKWSRQDRWLERWWFPLRRLSEKSGHRLSTPEVSQLEAVIAQYLYRGRCGARIERVCVVTGIATSVLVLLEYLLTILEFNLGTSLVHHFALSDFYSIDRRLEGAISFVNLVMMQFLVCWVMDAMLLTRAFALAIAHDKPAWPSDCVLKEAPLCELPSEWALDWMNIRLIALRTRWVSQLVWYPSTIIALMAVAAFTVRFGEFGFASNPVALAISVGLIVTAAVLLRRTAESWRGRVVVALDDAKLTEIGRVPLRADRVSQLKVLIKRAKNLNVGAFAPYSQQPIVRAVLVPALTYAATTGVPLLHGLGL